MTVNDISEQLSAAIRTAVREHRIEFDGLKKIYPLDDISIDYVDEDKNGNKIYSVFGQTIAMADSEFRDTGDAYSLSSVESETVDVSVSLTVSVNTEFNEISVKTEDILLGDENG